MVLTYYYYIFSLHNPADAHRYHFEATTLAFSLKDFLTPGASFISMLSWILYRPFSIFDNTYLMLYIPFSLIGFIGSLLFLKILSTMTHLPKKELFFIAFFLPNLVFWTSNLGKDSIIYFGLILVMFGFSSISRFYLNTFCIAVGAAVVYLVRPHVFLFLVCGILGGLFFEKHAFSLRRLSLFLVFFVSFLLMQNSILKYVGINVEKELNTSSAGIYYEAGMAKMESSARDLNSGGAATGENEKINLAYSLVYLFKFLGSPFIWQARKPIQIFSACENIIYQVMIIYLILHWKQVLKTRVIKFHYTWIIYIIITGIVLGAAQTNFGLIVRQKCMVLPFIFLLLAGVRQNEFAHRHNKILKPAFKHL
jgi:hypothetical protein